MGNKTFIFDYDDTLAPNHHDYSYAYIEFAQFVFQSLGNKAPDLQNIVNFHMELDKAAVATMGFRMERFPTTMRDAYKRIAESLGVTPSDDALARAYRIGMKAFDTFEYHVRGLLPGTKETLDFLTTQGDELILATKGDPKVQQKKIKATRMVDWFGKNIHILERKDAKVLSDIVGDRNKDLVWHVGNSKKSDMDPAIGAGIGAIYIPCETWAYERKDEPFAQGPRAIEIPDIKHLKAIYPRL